MKWCIASVLFFILCPWGSASAAELWVSEDGERTVEAGGFYKSLGTGIRMQRGLVDASEALGYLLDETRLGPAPGQASLLPEVRAVPLYGGTSVHTARAWSRFQLGERFELNAAWQFAASIASDPAFSAGAGLGSGLEFTDQAAARRRIVDFEPVLAESGGFLLLHNLDLLAFKASSSRVDVTVGRQVLSWGSGRLWNPTDLLSPFAPTDVDREVRRGVDAVRASISLASTAQLEALWLPQEHLRENGGVIRPQFNLGGFDFAPSAAKYVRDIVLGLDATGDLGPVGVHAEAAWTRELDPDRNGERDQFVRAVAGVDLLPVETLFLTAEYHFNGYGASNPADYLAVLQSPRVVRGEVFGAGRHYAGLVAAWQATELLTVQAITIANLTDPSVQVVPVVEYWAAQNVIMRLGGYLPFGERPDARGLRSLEPSDLLEQSEKWRLETSSFGLRSEYGASPLGAFAQVGVYWL